METHSKGLGAIKTKSSFLCVGFNRMRLNMHICRSFHKKNGLSDIQPKDFQKASNLQCKTIDNLDVQF